MTRKRKKRTNRSHHPNDPGLIKKAATRPNLTRGLDALASIWKRGLLPKDLENHYLMTWFAYDNGNVSRLSDRIGLHRNTLISNFREKVKKPSTIRPRHHWLRINSAKGKRTFPDKLYEFFNGIVRTPHFSKKENEGLANLWLMGVDRKTVRAHYILWALRRGMDLTEISKVMKKSLRGIHRYRVYATRPGSPAHKWFGPLKATNEEWYPIHRRGRKKKGEK